VPLKVLVGSKILGKMYHGVAGDNSPNGATYSDARGTFQKFITPNIFGQEVHWELIGPPSMNEGTDPTDRQSR
jgi:hypothetical protein